MGLLTGVAACPLDTFGVGEATGDASRGGSSGASGDGEDQGSGSSGSMPTSEGSGGAASELPASTLAAPVCGDGVVQAGEDCDDGNDAVADACIGCEDARCGDGFVRFGFEVCDAGGETDECDGDCSLAACGDGTVNAAAGEVCDDGPLANSDEYGGTCVTTCTGWSPSCGDGMLDAAYEACEPGSEVTNGGCSDTCQLGCSGGYGDCDGDPATGCETRLDADEHCGACDKKCGGLQQCSAGICVKA